MAISSDDLPGKQMHPVLEMCDSIAALTVNKAGTWVAELDPSSPCRMVARVEASSSSGNQRFGSREEY